jgi:hypothetical protein
VWDQTAENFPSRFLKKSISHCQTTDHHERGHEEDGGFPLVSNKHFGRAPSRLAIFAGGLLQYYLCASAGPANGRKKIEEPPRNNATASVQYSYECAVPCAAIRRGEGKYEPRSENLPGNDCAERRQPHPPVQFVSSPVTRQARVAESITSSPCR